MSILCPKDIQYVLPDLEWFVQFFSSDSSRFISSQHLTSTSSIFCRQTSCWGGSQIEQPVAFSSSLFTNFNVNFAFDFILTMKKRTALQKQTFWNNPYIPIQWLLAIQVIVTINVFPDLEWFSEIYSDSDFLIFWNLINYTAKFTLWKFIA